MFGKKTEGLVNKLFDEAFTGYRNPRSNEYKSGVLASLKFRFMRQRIWNPHKAGTAQCDAFISGITEGHAIWRRYESDQKADCEGIEPEVLENLHEGLTC